MSRLEVRLFGRRCGEVAIDNAGMRIPEDWSFSYDAAYLAGDGGVSVPLSVLLPLRAEPHVGAVVRSWFCNLMPEGSIRDTVVQRLRVTANDDFALLAAIGGNAPVPSVSVRW